MSRPAATVAPARNSHVPKCGHTPSHFLLAAVLICAAAPEPFLFCTPGAVPEPAALPLLPAGLLGEAPGGRPGRLGWLGASAQPLSAQTRLPFERQRPGVLQTGPFPWTLTRDKGLQVSAFSGSECARLNQFPLPITRLTSRRVRSLMMTHRAATMKSSPPPRLWCERKPYGTKSCAPERTAPSPSRRSSSGTSRSA